MCLLYFNQFIVSTTHNDILFEEYYYDGLGSRAGKITYEYYDYHKVSARETTLISLEGNLAKRIENSDFVCKAIEINTLEAELAEDKQCGGLSDATDINAIEVEYVNDLTYENELVLEVKEDSDIYNTYVYNRPVTSTLNEEVEVNVLSHTNSVNARIGEVVVIHEYEVNGKELEVVNDFEIVNEIGYNGEVEDNSDLQYLRARYYNQDNARFISEDNYLGEIGRSQSHNSYIYVENNGVNYKDPSGNSAASVYWPGVVHRGPGYIVVGDPNNYTLKITNGNLFYLSGMFDYMKWDRANREKGGAQKDREEVTNQTVEQHHEDDYYVNTHNLSKDDPQFHQKAVMCDELEDNGLTTDEITFAINNFTLEELEEFLKSGMTWDEWLEFKKDEEVGNWIKNPDLRTALEWISTIGGLLGLIPGAIGFIFDIVGLIADFLLQDWLGVIISIIAFVLPIVSKKLMDVASVLIPGGKLVDAVGTISRKVDDGISFVKKGIKKVQNGLKNWNPKWNKLKTVKNKLSDVARLFSDAVSSIGSRISSYVTRTAKDEVGSIFNLASGSDMSKVMNDVLEDMADPKLYGNIKNPWNKFQKLFSEHDGYKVLDSLKDGVGKFTKNPDQFINIDELYDLAKFSEKASSGIGAGLVFVSNFTGNVIVKKVLDKVVTKLYNIIDNR